MFINCLWFIEQAWEWETVFKPFTMKICEVIWICTNYLWKTGSWGRDVSFLLSLYYGDLKPRHFDLSVSRQRAAVIQQGDYLDSPSSSPTPPLKKWSLNPLSASAIKVYACKDKWLYCPILLLLISVLVMLSEQMNFYSNLTWLLPVAGERPN